MNWRGKIMSDNQDIIDLFAMFEPMDGVSVIAEGNDFIVEVACDAQPIHVMRCYVQGDQVKGGPKEKAEFLANCAATMHSAMMSLRALHDNPEAFANED